MLNNVTNLDPLTYPAGYDVNSDRDTDLNGGVLNTYS